MNVVIIQGGSESSTQPELNPNVVSQPIHVFLHTSESVRLEVQFAIVAGNDSCALCRIMVYEIIRIALKFYHTTPQRMMNAKLSSTKVLVLPLERAH